MAKKKSKKKNTRIKTAKLKNVNVVKKYEKQVFTLYTLTFLNLFLMISMFLSITGRFTISAKQVFSSLVFGYILTSLIFQKN